MSAAKRKTEKLFSTDVVLLTHGHSDHTRDLPSVYDPHKTEIYCIVELASYLRKQGYKRVHGLNFGGSGTLGDMRFSLVPARHTSSENGAYLGEAAGFVIEAGKDRVYHAGDTDVFGDMALIQRLYAPTVGLLPIGGTFTMDVQRAAFCANEYFAFDKIIPIHYDTFPGIEADPNELQQLVTKGEVLPLPPYEPYLL